LYFDFTGINLCPANFLEMLATGVILCQLAKLIEEKASGSTAAQVYESLLHELARDK